MSATRPEWLTVEARKAPLIVSLPHAGVDLPPDIEAACVSPWRARKDADWWIDRLYGFARDLDATIVHTAISRTAIDVNRDPSGVSLYPGQATTELCPTTTFDGEPLYKPGRAPDAAEVARRKATYFAPYHAALAGEIARLRDIHPRIVLYDCHSIRSVIPRLFDGALPNFNIGTNSGKSCDPALQTAVEAQCARTDFSWIANGRFTGGWVTRSHGNRQAGVHTVQMELACRGYMREEAGPVGEGAWPTPYDPVYAQPMRDALTLILKSCLSFARGDVP